MGLLRFLLAISVVNVHYIYHSSLIELVDGTVAVRSFFIISGFYIAMILNNNSYSKTLNFLTSRYLRLLPIYLICAVFSFLYHFFYGNYSTLVNDIPIIPLLSIFFANLTLFLTDLIYFFGIEHDGLILIKTYNINPPPHILLWHYLLIPQAWSLGCELIFYIFAPFLLRKLKFKKIFFFITISFVIRLMLVTKGYFESPWDSRFFPSELSSFLMGSLAYAAYKNNFYVKKKLISCLIFIIIVLIIIFNNKLGITYRLSIIHENYKIFNKDNLFYLVFTLSIGTIFGLTKDYKLDRTLGELSYPIYVSHMVISEVILNKINYIKNTNFISTLYSYSIILLISFSLYFFIQKRIDNFRKLNFN
jgi:peptidoglycan/LPS O-acetylase OafA/YrhL